MFQIESCAKPGGLNLEGRLLRFESNSAATASKSARKNLETMSGVILNRSQPKFAAKLVSNEMLCLKGM